MQYRRLVPGDFAAVAQFAIQGLRADLYPMLHLSRPKVDATIRYVCGSATDFHLAAFDDDGEVAGVIAAVVSELEFFERCKATIVMCRASVPGVGRHLIAALKQWADGDMRVRMVQFPLEFDARPGMARLLKRYGFTQQSTVCIAFKGAGQCL